MKIKPGQIWKIVESRFIKENPEDYYIVIKKLYNKNDKFWTDFFYLDAPDGVYDVEDCTSVDWLIDNAELESDVK